MPDSTTTTTPPVVSVPLPPKRVGDTWLDDSGSRQTIVSINPLVTIHRCTHPSASVKAVACVWELDGSRLLDATESTNKLVERLPRIMKVCIIAYKLRNADALTRANVKLFRDFSGGLGDEGSYLRFTPTTFDYQCTLLENQGHQILSKEIVEVRAD